MKLLPYLLISGLASSLMAQDAKPAEVEANAEAAEAMTNAEFDKKASKVLSNRRSRLKEFKVLEADARKFPEAKFAPVVIQRLWSWDYKNRTELTDYLLKTYMHHDSTVRFAGSLGNRNYKTAGPTLRRLLIGSNNKRVREAAALGLANSMSSSVRYAKLDDAAKKSLKEQAADLYRTLSTTEGIGESVASRAKNVLFKSENLSVGCVAPDIVGTDHEDKEFKLSDYRGKVVLLDFWGIW